MEQCSVLFGHLMNLMIHCALGCTQKKENRKEYFTCVHVSLNIGFFHSHVTCHLPALFMVLSSAPQ